MKNSQIHPCLASRFFFALLLAFIFVLTGCISRPPLNKQTFTFNLPALSVTNAISGNGILGIRNLQVAAPFEGRSLVYRTGEFSYVRDPYAEFLGPPAEELLAPLRGWLRDNGNFIAVTEAGSALKPDLLVEISVNRLFGDFRQPEHPAAVVTIRFVFFHAPNGVPEKAILQQEYSRSIPLSAPTAAALLEGWDKALADILAEVSSDFSRSQIAEQVR
ncbi:MAG TPA: ABC-type transport auxiliary lipoprotein family protein [Candidatus Sulfotelmatobacter sp.]|jgi:cholesterol transport system auxiliary component|nr:ABC-type transport auxiliary lipoprotein family protein [Candidatus Sulfotelmatobacter sp.]